MAALESVVIDYGEGWVIAHWHGEIDMANASVIERDTIEALQNKEFGLIIDLTYVTYLDSAAIRSIISIRKLLSDRQQKTVIVRPPESKLRRTLDIVGIPAIIPTFDSIQQAEAARLE
ncbi:MAG: STAS domain-containing protein [Actinomycetota bacterium]